MLGELGVLETGASGEMHLAGGEEVPGGQDLARSQGRNPWDVGRGPSCFIVVLWLGKLRL